MNQLEFNFTKDNYVLLEVFNDFVSCSIFRNGNLWGYSFENLQNALEWCNMIFEELEIEVIHR